MNTIKKMVAMIHIVFFMPIVMAIHPEFDSIASTAARRNRGFNRIVRRISPDSESIRDQNRQKNIQAVARRIQNRKNRR